MKAVEFLVMACVWIVAAILTIVYVGLLLIGKACEWRQRRAHR
jgi:hypothetical protein